MPSFKLIFVGFAIVFFILAAATVPTGRLNTTGAGLLCWLLSTLIP